MKLSLLFILHLFWLSSLAQDDAIVFHYTQRNGLPQNSINDIYFDQSRFLWLTTEAGLVRFDGNKFYTFSIANTPSINNDRFRWIETDANRNVFTMTIDGKRFQIKGHGILKYDDDNKYIKIKGLVPETSILNELQKGNQLKQPFINWYYRPLYIMKNDNEIWVRGRKALYQYKNVENIDSINIPNDSKALFRLGNFYYLYTSKNIFYINFKSRTLIKCAGNFSQLFPINLLSQQSSNNSVIVLSNGNVFTISKSDNPLNPSIKWLQKLSPSIKGVLSEIIYDSASNVLFIGSETNGLYILKQKEFTTTSVPANVVSFSGYYSHIALSDSTVLATNGFAFSKNKAYPSPYGLKNAELHVLLKDKRDALWSCSNRNIQYQQLGKAPRSAVTLNSRIQSIIEFGDSIIAINNVRLYIIHNYKIVDTLLLNMPNSLADLYAAPFENGLLLGLSDGVYKLNLQTKLLQKWFNFNQVRFLKHHNQYIFGTSYGSGAFVIYKNKLIPLPKDPKSYLDKSHNIQITKTNEIFISTNNGLFHTTIEQIEDYIKGKRKTVTYKYYNDANGIENTEFNGGGNSTSIALQNGYLTFANMGGIVWFNPSHLKPNTMLKKRLYIDAIYANDSLLSVDSNIQLQPYNNSVSIQVGCVHWQNPYNIRISYLLKGYHNEFQWLSNTEQPLQLGDIPPGTYTLVIKAIVGFNPSDESELVLTIIKLPKPYQTFWFKFFTIFFLAILILGSTYLYNLQLQKQNQELEQKVKERTSALEKTNKILLQSQNALVQSVNVRSKLISIISHDIVTPLKFISIVSKNFKTSAHHTPEKANEIIGEIHHTSQRLFDNAQNVLNWVRYQNNLITVKPVNVSPYVICEEIKDLLLDFAASQKNNLVNNVEMDDIIKTDKTILTIVLQNIIANAVKYCFNNNIEISSLLNAQGRYQIMVTDNGPGLSKQNLARINAIRNKSQLAISDDGAEGTGLGFMIIFELVELIGASITIESELNSGTKISVTI